MSRSAARQPRRPGGARHDPDGVREAELLDDHRRPPAHGASEATPLVCPEALLLAVRWPCQRCGEPTRLHAILALPEFESDADGARLLRRVAALPPALDKAARSRGRGRWRVDHTQRARGAHWHNHCDHCGARQSELAVQGVAGPFRPATYKARDAIRVQRVTGPFVFDQAEAVRHLHLQDWLAWHRRREARAAAKQAATRPARRARR